MKLSKKDGINLLHAFGVPTLAIIQNELLDERTFYMEKSWSCRLSPKAGVNYGKMSWNNYSVNLTSIHGCKDYNILRLFFLEHYKFFDIIIHPTVNPEVIGTVTRFENDCRGTLNIETYESFKKRNCGIFLTSESFEIYGSRIFISTLKSNSEDLISTKLRGQILHYAVRLFFDNYNLEFIVETGVLIFTDFSTF